MTEHLPSLLAGSHCQVSKDVIIWADDTSRKQMLEEKMVKFSITFS